MANRLVELIASKCADRGSKEVFRYKDVDTNKWTSTTWDEFRVDIENVAFALEILGVKEQENVGVFSQNCPQILTTDFALFYNRAVPVHIYATSSKQEVAYIVEDASIKVMCVGDQVQYRIAREVMKETGIIKQIITFNNVVLDGDDTNSLAWRKVMDIGFAAEEDRIDEVKIRMQAGEPTDLALLIYTSGTTGISKGVQLLHSNFDAAVDYHLKKLGYIMCDDDELSMCFLPLSHIFEFGWTLVCMYMNKMIAINENPKLIQDTIKEIRPQYMCSVPRFWEKVYTGINEKVSHMPPMQRALVKRAIYVGIQRNLKYVRMGKKVPFLLERQYQFFDSKVFAPMREAVGIDKGKFFPTAGAPLSTTIIQFLHAIGVNIVIGYGLTETTATVSCYEREGYKVASVGTPFEELQVRIGENNEVQIKGATIMKGYYNKPEEDKKAFTEDGWFRTGDAGRLNEDGSITLTERIKDLFKTSNGKYIAPQVLESLLSEDEFVEQVAVIGDQRKYVTALIVPVFSNLRKYADKKRISYSSDEDLVNDPMIYKMLENRIDELQKGLALYEQIKKFTLLAKPFTMESGELTNTLKMRRPVINEHFKDIIDEMYK